jgi:two-component system sensor histidine kinase HydH
LEGRAFAEVFRQTPLALAPILTRGLAIEEREIDWTAPDGEVVPLAVTVTPLREDRDDGVGAVVLLRDLRTLKALQERVERTERLAALGRLAAGVAHEIRNPLGAIRGLVQYFQATWKDHPEQRQYLDVVVRELEATLPPMWVDRDLLLQALLNLLLNAVEAMEPGGTLTVRLGRGPAGVECTIQDTGRGIPAEHLGRLFDPFFTTKRGGTGLGLAIAHSVIQAHAGEISVESAPGQGTSVTIRLPLQAFAAAGRP